MGYLMSLTVMMGFSLYGFWVYFEESCVHTPVKSNALFNALLDFSQCNSWVLYVFANVVFHLVWVVTLTICQYYQIVCLGMTTNERLNATRYSHFKNKGLIRSPFDKGPVRNCLDFHGSRSGPDWTRKHTYDNNSDTQPLLYV